MCLLRYVENALAFGHLALCAASIHPPNFKVAHQPVLPIAHSTKAQGRFWENVTVSEGKTVFKWPFLE